MALKTTWQREHTNLSALSAVGASSNTDILNVPGPSETVGQPPGVTLLMGIFTFSLDTDDGVEVNGLVVSDDITVSATVPSVNAMRTWWGAYHHGVAPQVLIIRSKRNMGPNTRVTIRAVKRVGTTATILSVYSQLLYLPK